MSYGLVTRSPEIAEASEVVGRQLLDYLDESDRDAVLGAGCPVGFARGEYMVRQGEYSDGLYLIRQGLVESIYRGPTGRELTLAYWSEGDFVGAPYVLGTQPNEWSARAIGRVTALQINVIALRHLITTCPAFAIALVECLGFKGRCYSKLAQVIATHNVESRIATLLITLARTFGIRDGERWIVGKVKQQELANMVGATRQSIGLVLRHFQDQGIIEVEPTNIVILDVAALRALSA